MIWTILFLLMSSVGLLAIKLYRSESSRMIRFYKKMTISVNCQTLYVRLMLLFILLFNLIYYRLFAGQMPCYLSAASILFILAPKRARGLLQGIDGNRFTMVFLFTIGLAALFIPGMFTFGVTLGIILLASIFFPSGKMDSFNLRPLHYDSYIKLIEHLIKTYYD